ncbi:TrmH family RNA methyltransferase [Proteiniclasticum sp. QWL-01]|uniref:TrmH family RNA methyltransferase n=1 Tax=Proteiniclasticum sp. QWL-01 TaxID=3036945 RepID=UPI0024117158|nr:TrmH family RNA methyltransferase [Proteiniclasticum sp. QWL-01]WFF74149.1 TrmH family RNA methyltransferase [Proteiniclasticum sp. QWL-01]
MNFYDIGSLDPQQKEVLFRERYPGKIKNAGKKHPVVDKVLALNKNTKPNPERLAALGGIWAMNLAQRYEVPIKYLLICPDQLKTIESQQLIHWFIERAEETFLISERVFSTLVETENGQGIMGVFYLNFMDLANFEPAENSLVLVLDGLEIPGNVGTILRSAEATGTQGVFLSNRKVRLNHPKLLRSSMGSVFKVPVIEAPDPPELIRQLLSWGYRIILADTDSPNKYYDLDYVGKVALVMGAEKYGISDWFYKAPHEDVMIPMLGDMDSLNVGVATTILLYEAAMKNKGFLKRFCCEHIMG